MSIPFLSLIKNLPSSTPFVGPETLERQHGRKFSARIGANESAFGISPLAAQALQQAVTDSDCSWYCDPTNYELRDLLAEKHGVSPENICVDAGIDSLLGLTVRLFVDKGTSVVTSDGAYPTFNYHVTGFDGKLHKVPYRNFHEDPEALIQKAHDTNARLIYFSNPDNPMGTCHTADKVQKMIDTVPGHCILLLDEAYCEFAPDTVEPDIDVENQQVMRFRTFSKAYGMAGMRIGYAIAHRELITGFDKIRNHFGVNRLAQIAAVASLKDKTFLRLVQEQAERSRQRIYQLADEMQLNYLPSATNFVAVDLGDGERTRSVLGQLGQLGVFVRMPGVPPLDRYLRVGIGNDQEHAEFESKFKQIMSTLTVE